MNVGNAVVGPALAAGIIWLIAFRLWRRKQVHGKGVWGGPVALAVGFLVGYVALLGMPPLKPENALDWLPVVAIIAPIPSLFQRLWGEKIYTFIPVAGITSILTVWIQSLNRIRYLWQPSEAFMWITGLGIGISLLAWNIERLSDRRKGASMPASIFVYAVMCSVVLFFSGSDLLGQLMGAVASVLGTAVILSWWSPQFTLSRGGWTVFSILFYGLILQGYWDFEMPLTSTLLVIISPLCLWYGESRKIFYMRPYKAVLWRMGMIVVPMSLALLIAGFSYFRDG
jgi:hypothetical protein